MERLDVFRIYLTRLEVFPGWDAWTLIPIVVLLTALIAAFAYYAYSLITRVRGEGVDWDAELELRGTPDDARNPLQRLLRAGLSILAFIAGGHAIWTRHFSSRGGRYDHHVYSADGAPAVAAGVLLCLVGVLLGAAALLGNSEFWSRWRGSRKPE